MKIHNLMQPDPLTGKDPLYGWIMVAVVFLLSGMAFGTAGALSVFLKPLSAEFGWGRSETALGYTTLAMSSAVFGVCWGYVADRWGTRYFGIVAALVMPLALYLLSVQTSLWQFYAFYFLFGALGTAMVSSPLFANVAFWFLNKPGLAIGITAAGGAVGQGVVPYFSAWAIETYDWRTAYMILAGLYLVVLLPVAFLVRDPPGRVAPARQFSGTAPTPSVNEIEVVVWISLAVIFCCNCMAVPIVHLVPLLTDNGISTEVAASVLLTLMLAGGVGRVLGGKLCDNFGALPTYMIMSLGQTVFAFGFPHVSSLSGLYVLAAFFGFGYSGVMSSILVLTRMMVSPGFSARAMSITAFFGWFGMGMGAFVGGLFFDMYRDYNLSFAYASMMGVANLAILMVFRARVRRVENVAVPI
ncbi:MAG: MFS transporter [Gammaproteobacteria bacterium]|nr:MAG: MFS transporter [Gammaproteobacteria bacterium]